MAKKTSSKKTAPKKEGKNKKSSAKLVSFTFGATIPTQSFGNITAQIVVQADSYEDARDFAAPRIEEIYAKYVEMKPKFLSNITETTKVVVPANDVTPAPTKAEAVAEQAAPAKSAPYMKASEAIRIAQTLDALDLIETQIQKSVKIDNGDKPELYTILIKRRKEIKK